ncbi:MULTISPECIES: type II asparaginase [unclassified Janthinobacterium]|uniref:type II asparaginase n=1 Tax=unclassified Janthinobacterium TaxID=2610881 RepID=UPI0003454912|nr:MULTISPECIES: type II asparaginase [unclassified Janthinobacterium]MEC5161668.1 L-asparaginase [Janthinobacterium sp. CG_S6]
MPHHRTPRLPRIALLATGGTIAGTAASSTATVGYTAATVGVGQLLDAVPELKAVAHVSGEQLFQIASENIGDAEWLVLARRVNALLASADVDGVVISHGTDTIEETAYFLNLVVRSAKPLVLVGAMRPSTAMSADGPGNLYHAVVLAASPEAAGKGALVALNGQINAARDVTKTNTSTPDAFKTPELGVLGYMHDNRPVFYRQCTRRHTLESEFDVGALAALPQVEIVYGHANMNRIGIDAFVGAGARGVVHAGVGDGSIAARVMPALVDARRQGCVVVRASRVGQGIVARNGVARDDELDFVVADTLSPQKARILLMLALSVTDDTRQIQRMFYTY